MENHVMLLLNSELYTKNEINKYEIKFEILVDFF